MPFNAQVVRSLRQPGRNFLQYRQRSRVRRSRAGAEKSRFAETDHQAILAHLDRDCMLRNLVGEHLLHISLNPFQVFLYLRRRQHLLAHHDIHGRDGFILTDCRNIFQVDRPPRGIGKNPEQIESRIDGLRYLMLLLLVGLGGGIEHYEERKQQRNEIRVRNQPSIVTVTAVAPSAFASHAACSRDSCSLSSRNPLSFTSSMRGLMPSRMEITPSSIISLR